MREREVLESVKMELFETMMSTIVNVIPCSKMIRQANSKLEADSELNGTGKVFR